MKRILATFALLFLTVSAGCSNPSAVQGCDLYATMESRCAEEAPSRLVAQYVCNEAQTADDDWLARLQEQQVRCAQETDHCDAYHDCKWRISLP